MNMRRIQSYFELLPLLLLFGINLAVTLYYSFQTSLLIGADTQSEYVVYIATIINGGWHHVDPAIMSSSVLDSCLSISLLPYAVYKITGGNALYVFKALYPVIASLVPVCIYYTARVYVNRRMAFLAGSMILLLVVQTWAAAYARNVTAGLLVALAILVMNRNIRFGKPIIAGLFALALLSYYAAGLFILSILIIQYVASKGRPVIGYGGLLLLVSVAAYWYVLINPVVMNVWRSAWGQLMSGGWRDNTIYLLIYDMNLIYIVIPLAMIIVGTWVYRRHYVNNFLSVIIAGGVLVACSLAIHDTENIYGVGRMQYILMPILAIPLSQALNGIFRRLVCFEVVAHLLIYALIANSVWTFLQIY